MARVTRGLKIDREPTYHTYVDISGSGERYNVRRRIAPRKIATGEVNKQFIRSKEYMKTVMKTWSDFSPSTREAWDNVPTTGFDFIRGCGWYEKFMKGKWAYISRKLAAMLHGQEPILTEPLGKVLIVKPDGTYAYNCEFLIYSVSMDLVVYFGHTGDDGYGLIPELPNEWAPFIISLRCSDMDTWVDSQYYTLSTLLGGLVDLQIGIIELYMGDPRIPGAMHWPYKTITRQTAPRGLQYLVEYHFHYDLPQPGWWIIPIWSVRFYPNRSNCRYVKIQHINHEPQLSIERFLFMRIHQRNTANNYMPNWPWDYYRYMPLVKYNDERVLGSLLSPYMLDMLWQQCSTGGEWPDGKKAY